MFKLKILGLRWQGWEDHEFDAYSKIQASLGYTILYYFKIIAKIGDVAGCLLSMHESLGSMLSTSLKWCAGVCLKLQQFKVILSDTGNLKPA